MALQPIPPTRGNLLRLQEELSLAREGYELLDQKREVLINELYRLVSELAQVAKQVNEKMMSALEQYRKAAVRLGEARMRAGLGPRVKETEVVQMERSVMGVRLPSFSVPGGVVQEKPGIWEGNADLDECYGMFSPLAGFLVKYTQCAMGVRRLAAEIRKTQRQVNALEMVFIPDYEETIRFIRSSLEEGEREGFFRQKRVKAKLARTRRGKDG